MPDKRAPAELAARQVSGLTDVEIERRINLIIAGEELRLPPPAALLLRELMREEYVMYRTTLCDLEAVFARQVTAE